ELPELCEVGTDQGEVVALVEAPQPQDALLAVLVPQCRPERVHRVGGIGDQTPLSHDLGSCSNAAYLWIDRMDVEVACHGPTLARRCTVMKRTRVPGVIKLSPFMASLSSQWSVELQA